MGDEYFSKEEFSLRPVSLSRMDVGKYANGQWVQRGEKAGFFDFTRELLSLRKQHGVGRISICVIMNMFARIKKEI